MYSARYTMAIGLALFFFSSSATAASTIIGNPYPATNGHLIVSGTDLTLWGATILAQGQTCWRGAEPWACGTEAQNKLASFAGNQPLTCELRGKRGDGSQTAFCTRYVDGKTQDLAALMVESGFALDRQAESGSMYALNQEEARKNRRGIWTSRFQSPDDWQAGIQQYVVYDMAKEPEKIVEKPREIQSAPYPVVIAPVGTTIIQNPNGSTTIIRVKRAPHDENNKHYRPPTPLPPQGEHPDVPPNATEQLRQSIEQNRFRSTDQDMELRKQLTPPP